jgi:hypothetical protein
MFKKFAIAAVVFLTFLATAQASTFNVSLDGFCNTFALTFNGFEIYGNRSGCNDNEIDGGASVHINGVLYRLSADTNDGSTLFNWYFTPAVKNHGNWYLYGSNGSGYTELNSGTYTKMKAGTIVRYNGKKDVTANFRKH